MSPKKIPVAVLISGSGTTLNNLLERIASGRLDAEIKLVISSRPGVMGLEYAKAANIPVVVLRRRDFGSAEEFSAANFQHCRDAGVQLVVMGGYLQHLLIPSDFENRVVNIHPGLIPSFCGEGFYGLRVHEAALEYGVKVSGCTVHFVNNQYDNGPIILQRTVEVDHDDTPESLAARIFEQECEAYPDAIQAIADRKISVRGRVVEWGRRESSNGADEPATNR